MSELKFEVPRYAASGRLKAELRANDDTTAGSYVNSLTFTELYSGWTEIRAVWNKSSQAILAELKPSNPVFPGQAKRCVSSLDDRGSCGQKCLVTVGTLGGPLSPVEPALMQLFWIRRVGV